MFWSYPTKSGQLQISFPRPHLSAGKVAKVMSLPYRSVKCRGTLQARTNATHREECHKPYCLYLIPPSSTEWKCIPCLSLEHLRLVGEILSTTLTTPNAAIESTRLRIFLHALLFVAGFSLVFIVGWSGSVTLVGQFFGAHKRIIAQIGGILVIIFGLATLGVIRLP